MNRPLHLSAMCRFLQSDMVSKLIVRHASSQVTVELGSAYRRPKSGWLYRRGTKGGYPASDPRRLRKVGIDLNLQQRLNILFAEDLKELEDRPDIGFPPVEIDTPANNRTEMLEWRKKQRNDGKLEKAARNKTLDVDVAEVKKEHLASGGLFDEIFMAADLYGIYEDLFANSIFRPCVQLRIEFDYDEETVTPVYRGNIIKPKEATTEPHVTFAADPDSLWTLVLTNPDGHLTQKNAEYLHWMVANIPGGDLSGGQTICPYVQPFPAFGTGYQRFIFVLYKQNGKVDLSTYNQSKDTIDLQSRTFQTVDFFEEQKSNLTPAGLSFFQSDWDSTLTKFFHDELVMKEPKYEYNFLPPYFTPWYSMTPRLPVPFNLFLDKLREPKSVQEEVLKKKLKLTHPFKGQLDSDVKYRNAHSPHIWKWQDQDKFGTWRIREIERERLRQGVYKDMDHTDLRKDPTNA